MLRKIARPLLASTFAVDGVQMITSSSDYANEAAAVSTTLRNIVPPAYTSVLPSSVESTARAMGTTKIVASGLLATGKAPRLAAAVLALLQVPAMLSRHAFWQADNDIDRSNGVRGLLTDAALLGGLFITSADTNGKPGLLWRIKDALPGKSEQQQMIENAQAKVQQVASTVSDKSKDVAEQVSETTRTYAAQAGEGVSEYISDNKSDWIETAESLGDKASDLTSQALTQGKKLSRRARKEAARQAKKLDSLV